MFMMISVPPARNVSVEILPSAAANPGREAYPGNLLSAFALNGAATHASNRPGGDLLLAAANHRTQAQNTHYVPPI